MFPLCFSRLDARSFGHCGTARPRLSWRRSDSAPRRIRGIGRAKSGRFLLRHKPLALGRRGPASTQIPWVPARTRSDGNPADMASHAPTSTVSALVITAQKAIGTEYLSWLNERTDVFTLISIRVRKRSRLIAAWIGDPCSLFPCFPMFSRRFDPSLVGSGLFLWSD